MPPAHNTLVEAVSQVQPNTVVVLTNGSAVSMPWHNEVESHPGRLAGGQGGSGGAADILSGVNPSGKLSKPSLSAWSTTSFLNPGLERTAKYVVRRRDIYWIPLLRCQGVEPSFPFRTRIVLHKF